MLRVGWCISNDRTCASSRLQGYLIHEWLQSKGYSSRLICENFNRVPSVWTPDFLSAVLRLRRSNCDVVVFEGGEWPMHQLARLWRRWGKRSVGVRCDPIHAPFDDSFDLTIVPTDSLRRILKIQRAVVIDDCVEVADSEFKCNYTQASKLRVAWVGHHGYESYITSLVARLRTNPDIRDNFNFELISKGPFATKQWSEATVARDIVACDIGLIAIPQDPWFLSKSTNRLVLMMSLGIPTVATLIPSYEHLARDGYNGLFVSSDDAIADCLLRLRDTSLRETLGRNARASVGNRYVIDNIGPQWLCALELALSSEASPLPINRRLSFIAKGIQIVSPW